MSDNYVFGVVQGHPPSAKMITGGRKWGLIYDRLPNMPKITDPNGRADDGWQGFKVANKKLARGAASSVSGYCYKQLGCQEAGWRIQTAIQEKSDCVVLWLRKIAVKS